MCVYVHVDVDVWEGICVCVRWMRMASVCNDVCVRENTCWCNDSSLCVCVLMGMSLCIINVNGLC